MTGKLPRIPEPEPPPFVRIKLFFVDASGSGTVGIGGVIVSLIILLLAAYFMRGELGALLQVPGELLGRFSRSDLPL